jgi:aryl-alcohol dehydrogenase-like predicted oxidoreductase
VEPWPGGRVAAAAARTGQRLRALLAARPRVPHRQPPLPEQLADDDWRKTNPRFTAGNFEKNLRIVDEVQAVASEVDASPAQVALAWLLAQGDDIAPIPGTGRVSRIEENTAADGIELSADQIQRLDDLTPATGERHDETNMSFIDG